MASPTLACYASGSISTAAPRPPRAAPAARASVVIPSPPTQRPTSAWNRPKSFPSAWGQRVEPRQGVLRPVEPHLDPPALDRHPIGQVCQLRAHGLGGHLEPEPGQPGPAGARRPGARVSPPRRGGRSRSRRRRPRSRCLEPKPPSLSRRAPRAPHARIRRRRDHHPALVDGEALRLQVGVTRLRRLDEQREADAASQPWRSSDAEKGHQDQHWPPPPRCLRRWHPTAPKRG